MIRFIIVAITVIGFLILSIPILLIEWIIGKFSPKAKEISSLRIIQAVFKFILWEDADGNSGFYFVYGSKDSL